MPWAPTSQGFSRGAERTYSMPQQSTHSSARPSPAQHSLSWEGRCDLPEPEATLHSFYRSSLPPHLSTSLSSCLNHSVPSCLACVPYPKTVPVSTPCSKPACLPNCACVLVCVCVVSCVLCCSPHLLLRSGSAPLSHSSKRQNDWMSRQAGRQNAQTDSFSLARPIISCEMTRESAQIRSLPISPASSSTSFCSMT